MDMHLLRLCSSSRSFSFVEMAVVLAVLAVLMAIAVPGYLMVRGQSHNGEVKTSLSVAQHAASEVWAKHREFSSDAALSASLSEHAPELVFVSGEEDYSSPKEVWFQLTDTKIVTFCGRATPSAAHFCLRIDETGKLAVADISPDGPRAVRVALGVNPRYLSRSQGATHSAALCYLSTRAEKAGEGERCSADDLDTGVIGWEGSAPSGIIDRTPPSFLHNPQFETGIRHWSGPDVRAGLLDDYPSVRALEFDTQATSDPFISNGENIFFATRENNAAYIAVRILDADGNDIGSVGTRGHTIFGYGWTALTLEAAGMQAYQGQVIRLRLINSRPGLSVTVDDFRPSSAEPTFPPGGGYPNFPVNTQFEENASGWTGQNAGIHSPGHPTTASVLRMNCCSVLSNPFILPSEDIKVAWHGESVADIRFVVKSYPGGASLGTYSVTASSADGYGAWAKNVLTLSGLVSHAGKPVQLEIRDISGSPVMLDDIRLASTPPTFPISSGSYPTSIPNGKFETNLDGWTGHSATRAQRSCLSESGYIFCYMMQFSYDVTSDPFIAKSENIEMAIDPGDATMSLSDLTFDVLAPNGAKVGELPIMTVASDNNYWETKQVIGIGPLNEWAGQPVRLRLVAASSTYFRVDDIRWSSDAPTYP